MARVSPKRNRPGQARAVKLVIGSATLFAATEDRQQPDEHRHEAAVEDESAKNRLAVLHIARIPFVVGRLDVLRLVSGQTRKNQHDHDRQDEVEHCAFEEEIHDHRYQTSDRRHHQEATHRRQILLRRVAIKARPGESRRRDEEDPNNALTGI